MRISKYEKRWEKKMKTKLQMQDAEGKEILNYKIVDYETNEGYYEMCHFHQKQIITRYLTRRPRLPANKELRDIAMNLGKWKRETRELWLDSRYDRNKEWLNEKNETN